MPTEAEPHEVLGDAHAEVYDHSQRDPIRELVVGVLGRRCKDREEDEEDDDDAERRVLIILTRLTPDDPLLHARPSDPSEHLFDGTFVSGQRGVSVTGKEDEVPDRLEEEHDEALSKRDHSPQHRDEEERRDAGLGVGLEQPPCGLQICFQIVPCLPSLGAARGPPSSPRQRLRRSPQPAEDPLGVRRCPDKQGRGPVNSR